MGVKAVLRIAYSKKNMFFVAEGGVGLSSKSARSEITLDELSDLYRCEEEEQLRAERRKSVLAPNSNSSQVVQLRVSASRDDLSCNGKLNNNNNNVNKQSKKINRLSCKIFATNLLFKM